MGNAFLAFNGLALALLISAILFLVAYLKGRAKQKRREAELWPDYITYCQKDVDLTLKMYEKNDYTYFDKIEEFRSDFN